MKNSEIRIDKHLILEKSKVTYNPDHRFFMDHLRPYYVRTRDGQYLFASTQTGRRPDRVFYMVPEGYRLGKGQRSFDGRIGKGIYRVIFDYLRTIPVLAQDGIQGEIGYKVGLRIITSLQNPHSAYMGWMGKLMIFPPEREMRIHCWNYIIPEPLSLRYVKRILEFWPEYDPSQPLTLFDFTEIDKDIRRVINLGVDYFGGAFKKPNLTMVWNKAESDGLISYHAGCTGDRVLKGLSGTGKTTLTVGPDLEQDDAVVGLPLYDRKGKVGAVELIGLEAASFAKSEGLTPESPEWKGLMKSKERDENGDPYMVLAMNIDCEGVDYVFENINGCGVKIPRVIEGEDAGSPRCTQYEKSGTTNGRFIFRFRDINPNWGHNRLKILRTEGLSFKRFDMIEPIIRVIDPVVAVALDSACESIITSAVSGKKPGTRARSYSATDFMAREQAEQALLKLKVYSDLGLGVDGKLVFFITNSGYLGEYDFMGNQILTMRDGAPVPKIDGNTGEPLRDLNGNPIYQGQGEKIRVEDSKKLVELVEQRKIKNWIINPIFGYLVPDPKELEGSHGMKDFRKRFNPLRYYTPAQILAFAERDIEERTGFLNRLFEGQKNAENLSEVTNTWKRMELPLVEEVRRYYETLYGKPE
ncbi:MAG: hypothetical protein KAU14_05675 [Thermoplasmata archaeon]|nr:hypothetical protein [Thermoplasmata archaeon]